MSYKVLQVNSVCGVGSTGRIAVDIHKTILGGGNESVIAYGRGRAPEDVNTVKIGNSRDQAFHGLLTRLLDKHGFGSKRVTKKFIKEIDKLSPDLIHLHNIHGYYLNVPLLFRYLRKIQKPVVWTFHDVWPITGHCSYFGDCEKWKTSCSHCPRLGEYPKSFYDRSVKNYKQKKEMFSGIDSLTLVSPSEWLADILKESYLGNYPVQVINNGIDRDIFKPGDKTELRKKHGFDENDKIILGVATMFAKEERKGLKFFIEMAGILKDYKFVLVGLDSGDTVQRLPENILAVKRVENARILAEYYSLSDIFCNPTLEDNYPTVNMEAMACGTPVVAFNTGGIKEQVPPECGAVVDKGDIGELIKNIKIILFEGNYDTYKDESIKFAANNFEKHDKYMQYINLYEQLIKNQGGCL